MTLHDTHPCSIDGCSRPRSARGWCNTHWKQWRATGNPIASVDRRAYYAARRVNLFESRVPHRPKDGCWEWQGNINPDGYGRLGQERAHRIAWTLATNQPIPDGFDVLHACDNPPCVRNDESGWYEINGIVRPRFGHLWLGTSDDNIADKCAKGRQAVGDRARIGKSKLTRHQVTEIRDLHTVRRLGAEQLSRLYPVSPQQIRRILREQSWQ